MTDRTKSGHLGKSSGVSKCSWKLPHSIRSISSGVPMVKLLERAPLFFFRFVKAGRGNAIKERIQIVSVDILAQIN